MSKVSSVHNEIFDSMTLEDKKIFTAKGTRDLSRLFVLVDSVNECIELYGLESSEQPSVLEAYGSWKAYVKEMTHYHTYYDEVQCEYVHSTR